MQGLQHQPVAAQRDDDVGLGGRRRAIDRFEAGLGLAGRGRGGTDEGEAGSGRGLDGHTGYSNASGAGIVL